jgi:hypothetical protein
MQPGSSEEQAPKKLQDGNDTDGETSDKLFI